MSIRTLFTCHPASVGETYFEHLRSASGFGFAMLVSGVACCIHGLLPFVFVTVGSNTVKQLYARMVVHRGGLGPAAPGQCAEDECKEGPLEQPIVDEKDIPVR